MNNLKIRKFNDSILNNAKLITRGSGFFSTYDLNNGNIIKVVKSVDDCYDSSNALFLYSTYNDFMDDLYAKLMYSTNVDLSSIIIPNAIYLDKDIVRAYTVPKQENCVNLDKFISLNNNLDTIASILIKMTKEIRLANKNNINMPDLGNSSNVLVNTKNKSIKFIDYDGMQIDKYPSFCISSLINNQVVPVTRDKRFHDIKSGMITNNTDKLSLYSLFIFYSTRTLLNEFGSSDYTFNSNGKLILKESVFYNYTKMIGIENTELEDDLYRLFYCEKINYPDTSIKKILKTHYIDNNRFIKKY